MTDSSWIRLYRKLIDWQWYTEKNMVHFFIYCLLRANHKDGEWRGEALYPGQFITGLHRISSETGLTIQEVRTCISKLKKSGELTIKTTNKYSVFTVNSWISHQSEDGINKRINKRTTNEQQTNNKPSTTNKNDKNDKNDKEEYNRFEDWWSAYGKKGSRKKCIEKWFRLKEEDKDRCIAVVSDYVARTPNPIFRKNGETYLNQESWRDELPPIADPRPSWAIEKEKKMKEMMEYTGDIKDDYREPEYQIEDNVIGFNFLGGM